MTPPDDAREVERVVVSLLDAKGPMSFASLLLETNLRRSIHPAVLHDLLNNLLAAGILALSSTGIYSAT